MCGFYELGFVGSTLKPNLMVLMVLYWSTLGILNCLQFSSVGWVDCIGIVLGILVSWKSMLWVSNCFLLLCAIFSASWVLAILLDGLCFGISCSEWLQFILYVLAWIDLIYVLAQYWLDVVMFILVVHWGFDIDMSWFNLVITNVYKYACMVSYIWERLILTVSHQRAWLGKDFKSFLFNFGLKCKLNFEFLLDHQSAQSRPDLHISCNSGGTPSIKTHFININNIRREHSA